MSTKAHTPTPWHVMYPKAFDYKIVESIGDRVIAHIDGQYPDQDDKDDNEDRHHADAKIIVHAVNHHEELLTRLYALKNEVGNLIHDLNDDIPEDHDIRFFYKEAQETIKRVKPEGFTIEEDAKAMNIKCK